MHRLSKPFLSAAAALLFAAAPVAAQNSRVTVAEREARERMARDAADSAEREMTLELIERYHRSGERREPRLALAQIKEDFLRLQVVNNDLAKAAKVGGQLDLKLVAKSASEIRKRAERLKDNLALPEPGGEAKAPAGQAPADLEQLRTAVSRLDGIVLRFANNLHAKGVGRFDAQLSDRLRRDLEAIVSLSERVRKSSEKLGGAAR